MGTDGKLHLDRSFPHIKMQSNILVIGKHVANLHITSNKQKKTYSVETAENG